MTDKIKELKENILKWYDSDDAYNLYYEREGKEITLREDLYLVLELIENYKWMKSSIENIMNLQWSEIEILVAEAKAARLYKSIK